LDNVWLDDGPGDEDEVTGDPTGLSGALDPPENIGGRLGDTGSSVTTGSDGMERLCGLGGCLKDAPPPPPPPEPEFPC
jgi:hypothetical protein